MAADTTALAPRTTAALTRYRVMAYVVGVMLVVLVFVAVPLNYLADVPEVSAVVSPIHGFLYIVYLLAAFDLALKARFTAKGTVLVLLAGVVPFVSFWAERRVTARVLRVTMRSATNDSRGTVPASRTSTVPFAVQRARRARSNAASR